MILKLVEAMKMPEGLEIRGLGLWYAFLSKIEYHLVKRAKIPANCLNTQKRNKKVIVSITSFPARINYVYYAIKTMLLQTYKPDRIILWLADEQFPDHELPHELKELEQYGLEICWCDDLYGHKKYFYCVERQKPDEVIITFDDDILYPVTAIERLMNAYKRNSDCLICERAQAIDYDESGGIKNPGLWNVLSDVGVKEPSYSLNPSPGGGCLIPYGAFYKDAIDKDMILEYAYKNDDLWYMFMAAENGTRTLKTRKYHKTFSVIPGSQVTQMATENIIGNKNMIVFEKLKKAYPTAYRRITTDKD